ncbi:MAG: hypothetical protein RL272_190 [Candidatus Parcubacteria bacterium]|jgi:ADP-ribose pyrophosphatase YjhB (NUDIX family)
MKRTRTAGGVVIHAKTGKILVVSQNGDSWSLPKGHLEDGESDLAAAVRETAEESGVTQLELVRPLGEYERPKIGPGGKGDDASELKTIVMFMFRTTQDDIRPQDPRNPEARWVAPDEVAGLLTHEKDKEFILRILGSMK